MYLTAIQTDNYQVLVVLQFPTAFKALSRCILHTTLVTLAVAHSEELQCCLCYSAFSASSVFQIKGS